jgi:hypothetical protein
LSERKKEKYIAARQHEILRLVKDKSYLAVEDAQGNQVCSNA